MTIKARVPSTFEMELGTNFHDFARDFFEFLDYETLVHQTTIEGVRQLFRFLILPETPDILKELCENFVLFESERYWKLKKTTLDPMYYFKPAKTELYIQDKDSQMAGIVDRIDRMSDDSLAIVEYKTGNPKIPSVKRELAFYKILIENAKIFEEPIRWMVIYNPNHNKYHLSKFSPQLMSACRRRIVQFKRAHQIDQFPKRESLICTWCQYKGICLENDKP